MNRVLILLTGFLCMVDISSTDVSTWSGVVAIVMDSEQTIQTQGTYVHTHTHTIYAQLHSTIQVLTT